MYDFLVKKGQMVALLTGVGVLLIFFITAYTGLNSAGYSMSTDLVAEGKDKIPTMDFFDVGLALTIALFFIALVLAFVVFGIIGFIKFPKEALRSGVAVLALVLVFGALYAIAPYETTGKLGVINEKFQITEGVSKFISAGLNITYLLSAAAILLMILGEIRNAFK